MNPVRAKCKNGHTGGIDFDWGQEPTDDHYNLVVLTICRNCRQAIDWDYADYEEKQAFYRGDKPTRKVSKVNE